MSLRIQPALLPALLLLTLLVGCQTSDPSLLFVQVADGGRLLSDDDGDGWSELVLDGVSPHVVYFSDRPERITGTTSVDTFLAGWDEGTDSFEHDPPNAAVAQVGSDTIEIVELRRPVLEGTTLTYTTRVLQKSSTFAQVEAMRGISPVAMGGVVLFIDNLTMSTTSGFRGSDPYHTRSDPMNRRDDFGR